ncbi:hypothetical protein AALA99_08640 [Anaerotruncus colihominis]|uniref:Uncharacterized protein n=1 Tax=Anaerotruncus colihominis TaxID=169435 RepID=A0A845RGR2_9FIRM|nr:hypothetical protein [Anaerotruncus colihominis]NBI78964.1 hypothetical protein [Anaerotruncus colihominis]
MDWQENFLSGKEGKHGNPGEFQAFLTRSGRKIFRQGVCLSHWYSFLIIIRTIPDAADHQDG